MTVTTAPSPSPVSEPVRPRGFTAARWVLRVFATLHALLLIWQPISIGQYLSGAYAMRDIHAAGAALIPMIGFLLIPVASWYVVAGGRRWVLLPGIGFLFLDEAQSIAGHVPQLAVHVPLGVGLVMLGVAFGVWVWTPASGRLRARRTDSGRNERGRSGHRRRSRRLQQERAELNRAAEQLVDRQPADVDASR